jgi:nitrate reductase assembly molybdenum cofactor insertion protein NarJ
MKADLLERSKEFPAPGTYVNLSEAKDVPTTHVILSEAKDPPRTCASAPCAGDPSVASLPQDDVPVASLPRDDVRVASLPRDDVPVASLPRDDVRAAFAALAPLFRYPDASFAMRLGDIREVRRDRDLEEFVTAISRLSLRDQQVTYTSTFDLAPSCSPYLGAHRFGEESPERARFMVGLRTRYADRDATELPDHIAEVLGFAARYEDDEWDDLGRLVLVPAIAMMDDILRPTTNPYRHLVAAVRHLSAAAFSDGGES